MKFNINRDFLNNSKILCISGLSGKGKTKLALKIIESLNLKTYYFDTNTELSSKNDKIFIIHEFNYNLILDSIDIIKNRKEKCIIVIDNISNIYFNDYIKSYSIKKFINILNKIQQDNNIKFIIISNQYTSVTNSIRRLVSDAEDYSLNMFYIEDYEEVKKLNLKKQLLSFKIKKILN